MPFLPVASGKLYPHGSTQNVYSQDVGVTFPCSMEPADSRRGVQATTQLKRRTSRWPQEVSRIDNPGFGGFEPVCDWLPSECVQVYAEASDDMSTVGGYFFSDQSWGLANVRSQDLCMPIYRAII